MAYGYVNPVTGFTIELWFKSNATSPNFRALFNSRTQGNVSWFTGALPNSIGRQMIVSMTSSVAPTPNALTINMVRENTNSGSVAMTWTDTSGPAYASDNQWHHLAIRLLNNQKTWTVFVDGEIVGSGTTTLAVVWKPSVQLFGGEYAGHIGDPGSNFWKGWLAYPTMYERALSDNRILEHYTAGTGGTVYYGDTEGMRLDRIAEWAELPEQSREFETSVVTLQGIQVEGSNALQAMQDATFASGGKIFADGQSRLVYHNRRHSYNRWSVVKFAESLTAAPEVGIVFTLDNRYIYNDIRGERPFGSQVRLIDDDSKAAYGRKVLSFSVTLTDAIELQNYVSWLASQYRDASVRISNISLRSSSSDVIEWAATGGLQLGDVITFDEMPVDQAPDAQMKFVVEKIGCEVDIINREWILDLELSPFDVNEVFQIGVTGLGSRYRVAW